MTQISVLGQEGSPKPQTGVPENWVLWKGWQEHRIQADLPKFDYPGYCTQHLHTSKCIYITLHQLLVSTFTLVSAKKSKLKILYLHDEIRKHLSGTILKTPELLLLDSSTTSSLHHFNCPPLLAYSVIASLAPGACKASKVPITWASL